MDTSETYIKMCDCVEVQGQWQPSEPDFTNKGIVDWINMKMDGSRKLSIGICDTFYKQDDLIWLPQQDEIQKMMGDISQIGINVLVNKFYVFCLETTYKEGYLATAFFETFEQLWLAFYMYEKHNKSWNNMEWVTT